MYPSQCLTRNDAYSTNSKQKNEDNKEQQARRKSKCASFLDFRSYELAEPSLARVSARPLLTAWPDVAAVRRVSACWWSRLLVRTGGAGASGALIARLLPLVARRRRVLLMVGWIITDTG